MKFLLALSLLLVGVSGGGSRERCGSPGRDGSDGKRVDNWCCGNFREEHIPMVDLDRGSLGDYARNERIAQDIDTAAREFGTFHVINHDVPNRVITNAESVMHKFFDLNADVKASQGGYSKKTNSEILEVKVTVEDLLTLHPLLNNSTLSLGEYMPEFSETTRTYLLSLYELASELLLEIGIGLDVPEKAFERYMDKADFALRYHKFDPLSSNEEYETTPFNEEEIKEREENIEREFEEVAEEFEGVSESEDVHIPEVPLSFKDNSDEEIEPYFRCDSHTHTGSIAIYWQDNTGTQVFHRSEDIPECDGVWTSLENIPGTFFVVIGDTLDEFSFGNYFSAPHKHVSSDETRYVMELHVHAGCDCASLWREESSSNAIIPHTVFVMALVSVLFL